MFVLPQRVARQQTAVRHGAAAVEFAICLPVLMALVFGTIEASNAVFLQQALTAAAFEAANIAIGSGNTAENATTRANEVLTGLGISSPTVTVTPVVTGNTPSGTDVVVTCSAPLSSNTVTHWCLGNRTLTASVTMSHL